MPFPFDNEQTIGILSNATGRRGMRGLPIVPKRDEQDPTTLVPVILTKTDVLEFTIMHELMHSCGPAFILPGGSANVNELDAKLLTVIFYRIKEGPGMDDKTMEVIRSQSNEIHQTSSSDDENPEYWGEFFVWKLATGEVWCVDEKKGYQILPYGSRGGIFFEE